MGHAFHGLQPQKEVPTAGEALCEHLTQATGGIRPSGLQFASRTDKGVHALESIATCWFRNPFDTQAFLKNIQILRTPGLLSIHARQVAYNVNARGCSRGKHYRYVIEDNHELPLQQNNPFAWSIVPKLDVKKMREATQFLIGEHDFQSFRAAGCSASSSVKHIFRLDVSNPIVFKNGSRQIQIDFVGDAFLRQMIRLLAGVLIEVGAGLRKPSDVQTILEAHTRQAAGITAPAHGLMLMQVMCDY